MLDAPITHGARAGFAVGDGAAPHGPVLTEEPIQTIPKVGAVLLDVGLQRLDVSGQRPDIPG